MSPAMQLNLTIVGLVWVFMDWPVHGIEMAAEPGQTMMDHSEAHDVGQQIESVDFEIQQCQQKPPKQYHPQAMRVHNAVLRVYAVDALFHLKI